MHENLKVFSELSQELLNSINTCFKVDDKIQDSEAQAYEITDKVMAFNSEFDLE